MVMKEVDKFEVNEYTTTHKIKDLAGLCLLVGLGYMLTIIMFLA